MRTVLCAALGLSLMGAPAHAADIRAAVFTDQFHPLLHKVHSLHQAEHKLRRLGYYGIDVERASLPYSFRACKRGVRYHIHVDYYGDLVQVDELGRCRDYGDDYSYRSRSRYGRYDY